MSKALSDDVTDTPGHAEPGSRPADALVQPALFDKQPDDLAQKQRVPLSCVMHCAHNLLLWTAARDAGNEASNIRFAQPFEGKRADPVLPRQLGQRCAEWMMRSHLGVAVGPDHEQMVITQRAGDELQ